MLTQRMSKEFLQVSLVAGFLFKTQELGIFWGDEKYARIVEAVKHFADFEGTWGYRKSHGQIPENNRKFLPPGFKHPSRVL